jgi:hypothetical protein
LDDALCTHHPGGCRSVSMKEAAPLRREKQRANVNPRTNDETFFAFSAHFRTRIVATQKIHVHQKVIMARK